MGKKPNLTARLQAVLGCGCTSTFRCHQHWSLMSQDERAAFVAQIKARPRHGHADRGAG